jgi:hypothetical protein
MNSIITPLEDTVINLSPPKPDQDSTVSLLQHENLVRLVLQGFSREEAERMSQPKPINWPEMEKRMMKEQKRRLRGLARLDLKRRDSSKPRKLARPSDEIEIRWVDIRPPDQFKTKDGEQN